MPRGVALVPLSTVQVTGNLQVSPPDAREGLASGEELSCELGMVACAGLALIEDRSPGGGGPPHAVSITTMARTIPLIWNLERRQVVSVTASSLVGKELRDLRRIVAVALRSGRLR